MRGAWGLEYAERSNAIYNFKDPPLSRENHILDIPLAFVEAKGIWIESMTGLSERPGIRRNELYTNGNKGIWGYPRESRNEDPLLASAKVEHLAVTTSSLKTN